MLGKQADLAREDAIYLDDLALPAYVPVDSLEDFCSTFPVPCSWGMVLSATVFRSSSPNPSLRIPTVGGWFLSSQI
jgi:hypothetical protein